MNNTDHTHNFLSILSQTAFAQKVGLLYEIAYCECEHRNNHTLTNRAPRKNYTEFEWRFLLINDVMRGVLSEMQCLRISLSLISNFPSKELMEQYGYSEKGYCQYHYYVICHKISTIHDLFFKLVSLVCDFDLNIEANKHTIIKWDDLELKLKAKEHPEYEGIIESLSQFHKIFKRYIEDRHKGSHEGLIYNEMFDDFYMTDIWTDINKKSKKGVNPKFLGFCRGTIENENKLETAQNNYVQFLIKAIEDMQSCTLELFNSLDKVINLNIDKILLDAKISCLQLPNVKCCHFTKPQELKRIIEIQVDSYWHNKR